IGCWTKSIPPRPCFVK
nr:Chain B, Bowman-Birk trypsin inhibitor [Odorrana versabilis]